MAHLVRVCKFGFYPHAQSWTKQPLNELSGDKAGGEVACVFLSLVDPNEEWVI